MYFILLIALFALLGYYSWISPSFALSFFLLFSITIDLYLDKVGIGFSRLIIRYAYLIVILYRSYAKDNIFLKRFFQNPISFGFIVLLFSVVYYYFELDDINNSSRADFVQTFFLFTFFPAIISFYVLNTNQKIIEFINGILFFSVVFYFSLYITNTLANVDFTNRESYSDETTFDSIGLSRLASIILITSLYSFSTKEIIYKKIQIISLIIISIFFILSTVQRGSIIGIIVSFLFYLLLNRKHINLMPMFIVTFVLFAATYIGITTELFSTVYDRFADLQNAQDFERAQDYTTVMNILNKNSYIYGLGPRGYMFATGREYPHNFFLEQFVEYGLLGMISSILLILGALRCLIIRFSLITKNKTTDIILYSWLFMFISVLVSGNIITNSNFFCISIILITLESYYNLK